MENPITHFSIPHKFVVDMIFHKGKEIYLSSQLTAVLLI